MDASQASEELDTLYEVGRSDLSVKSLFRRVFQVIASLLVGLWFSSKLWQMLFVERSLLSRPPASSELDSNENQPESAGPRPPPGPAGAAESGEAPSSAERETSSRPEQRPAVEGCVEMATSDLHVPIITG